MRLSLEHIDKISDLIVDAFLKKDIAVFKVDADRVKERIKEVILRNMEEEDELDREVEKILQSHAREMEEKGVDYRKMFRMVKNKLARERKFVL